MNEITKTASRRSFLGGVAGTLGGATLPSIDAYANQAEIKNKSSIFDSIVIGAGFAGLAAARDLSKKGHSVLLIEARNRIGGRTFTSQYDGTKIELGGTWIHWTQPNVWNEITRYGLNIAETPGATPDYLSWLSGKKLTKSPAGDIWLKLSNAMEHFCNVDGQGGRVVMPRPHDPLFNLKDLKKWDALSLQDRLNTIKLNQQTKDLLSPQLSINCHNELSKGGFADMLRWWSLGDFDMGRMFDKLGRFKINEGMSELAIRMLKDSNSQLLLSTPVKSIRKQNENYLIATGNGESFASKSVVLAVPINTLSNIEIQPGLSEYKQKFAKDGQTGRGTKFYIHIKEKIGNWMGSAPYPSPITLTFTEKQRDDGTLLVAFGPPNLLNITDEDAVEKALRTLIPKVNVVGVTGYQWDVDPYSKGTWCWYRPNQLTDGLIEMRRTEDGIFMAGADVASGWRGFVDGALESGITAARDVTSYLRKS